MNEELHQSEEALRRAMAMPNETLPELFIQGAEIVTAVGTRAMLLLGNLTELRPGVVFEDEIEARAAVDTFNRACHRVQTALSEVVVFLDKRREE